jgi:Co/Zn/Cd efflux system component
MAIKGVKQCKDMHLWKYRDGHFVFDVRILTDDAKADYDSVSAAARAVIGGYPIIK